MANETETKLVKDRFKTTAVDLFGTGARMYVLHFRAANRPPLSKVFTLNGDLPEAIQRGKDHCERMNYRFCGCYPFVVDLDKQEKLRNDELGIAEY